MLKAAFRIQYPGSSVDETNGIVSGCRLAEVNKLAQFAGADGKLVELMVSPTLISDLLGLCEKQGRLDAYWTHDRLTSETQADALHDSVGVWRNFRKDENGNLIADIQLAPTEYRDRVLWAAKNDPLGIMTSMVFDYQGGKENARAVKVESGDFVRFGAATTCLLSAYKTAKLADDSNTMDTEFLEKLKEALKDEHIMAAIKALIKSVEKAGAADETTETDADAIETEAGVMAEDKKEEDKDKPAFMRAALRINRAHTRKTKIAVDEAVKKVAAEAAILAEASVIGRLGKGGFSGVTAAPQKETEAYEAAIQARLADGSARTRGAAIYKVNRECPELHQAHLRATGAGN